MDEPPWRVSEPPTDRHFLALAIAAGTPNDAVMIVAEYQPKMTGHTPDTI